MKKVPKLILLCTAVSLCAGALCATASGQSATLTLSGGEAPAAISDGDYYTAADIGAGERLNVTSPGMTTLYLIWDREPGPWYLESENDRAYYGQNGFLHEAVTFDVPCDSVTVKTLSDARLCDVYCFSGELPDWVQLWDPPCADADLLVLPTHADDEYLMFGGTIPYYTRERGMAVQVAYMTHHRGEPERQHEQLNGLWEAGVRAYPVFGQFADRYSDSLEHAHTLFDHAAVLDWQTALLRRFRPEVVVGHDPGGEYGHGAHRLSSLTLCEAVATAADPAYECSYSDSAPWQIKKLYLHLYKDNMITMDWDRPMSDGMTPYEAASAAFDMHLSQHKWVSMGRTGAYNCFNFGLYYTAVGADSAKNDFFENIVYPPDPPEREPVSDSSSISSSALPESSVPIEPIPAQHDLQPWPLICVAAAAILAAVLIIISRRRRSQ